MEVLLFAMEQGIRLVRHLPNSPEFLKQKSLGVLLDNAQELLKQPKLTEGDLLRRFRVAVRDALQVGLTSIHDAGLDPTSLSFFRRL